MCDIIDAMSDEHDAGAHFADPVFPGFDELARKRRALVAELADERRRAGLTQTVVAARMRTSQSVVARLERGDLDVRLSTIERYAAALGREIEWRVTGGEGV